MALPTKKARLNETSFKSHHKPSIKGKEKATSLASSSKATSLPITFKVVAGSYERLLYGLEGSTFIQNDKVSFILRPIFIFPAHVSPIKAVAASPSGKWLATGSADEIIKVWDLKRRKEIGGLMHHEGFTFSLFSACPHYLSRLSNHAGFSFSLTSRFCFGRWDYRHIPRARLECTKDIAWTQRTDKLRRCPSKWEGRLECRQRFHASDVGYDEGEGRS